MIAIDTNELLRQLTPTPLRKATLLRSLLRAAVAPVATLLARQQDYEDSTAFHVANDGIRTVQIRNSVANLLGIDPQSVTVNDSVWQRPKPMYSDDDPRQQYGYASAQLDNSFHIYNDASHNASLSNISQGSSPTTPSSNIGVGVGTGGIGGATASPGGGNGGSGDTVITLNSLKSQAAMNPPRSFIVQVPTGLDPARCARAKAFLADFKPPTTSFTLIDNDNYTY